MGVIALTAALAVSSKLSAQAPVEPDRGREASATLPESNEALLLSGRVEDAARAGDFRLAIELISQIMKLPAELVASPGSRTYQPVWRHASRLIAQLPDAGLQMYRQLHDAEAAAMLAEAARAGDAQRLRVIFREYPHTSCWVDIGRELIARLLDAGDFAGAIEILHELLASEGDDAELRAQLVIASIGAGAPRLGEVTLERLLSDATLRRQPRWGSKLATLSDWLSEQRRVTGRTDAAINPALGVGDAWMARLSDGPSVSARDLAEAIDTLRRLPLIEPAVSGDVLVIRCDGELRAFDLLTLARRWKRSELRPEMVIADISAFPGDAPGPESHLPRSTTSLLTNYLRHAVSVGFGNVYSIEGLPSSDNTEPLARRPFQMLPQLATRAELVARSLADGSIVWRTGVEGSHPLAGASMQDRPLLLDDRLVVPYTRNADLRLAVLDPQTGRVVQDISVVGPPLVYLSDGGRCLLSADETSIQVSTGNGVVASLSRRDLSWQWACTYPSSLTQRLAQTWWQPSPQPIESGVDRPIVAENLLIVAPMDSHEVFGIDRFTGRERWRFARRESLGLVGVVDAGLVLVGSGLTCVDLNDPDGRPPKWRTVSLEVVGRPVIDEPRIFVPTRTGIVVVDSATGKLTADQQLVLSRGTEPDAEGGDAGQDTAVGSAVDAGNLLVAAGGLYCVTPDRLVRVPDVAQTRAIGEQLALKNPADPRAALLLAWVEALSGSGKDALARLQTIDSKDPELNAARDRLLGYVFLELARSATPGEDRLAWLKQAAGIARSPETAARLAAIIGAALEQEQRWSDAIQHYGEVLAEREARHAPDAADPTYSPADWLHAVRRLRALRGRVPAALMEAELCKVAARLEALPGALEALSRLDLALTDGPAREAVDRAFVRLKLPPEFLAARLGVPGGGGDPAERRRAHLLRWETHVALQKLGEAREDATLWKERFASDVNDAAIAAAGKSAEPLERDRAWAQRIEQEQRKIADALGKPFVNDATLRNRRWRMVNAELVMDLREPMSDVRNWIPVRARDGFQLQLIEIGRNQQPWRQTPDAVGTTPAADDLMRALANAVQSGENRLEAWPALFYENHALIPAPGGLVCIGLAPGRTARKRAWELPVPHWATVPRDFADKSAGGPQGAYICPRVDRIALIGWMDGKCWWQRDLGGVAVERLVHVAERLLVITQDHQVFSFDATFGDHMMRPPADVPTATLVAVVEDTILLCSADGVTALDAATLAPRWTRPIRAVERLVPVTGRPWVAFRAREQNDWSLLNAETGEPVFAAELGESGELTAIAFDGERLMVAGRKADSDAAPGGRIETSVAALDPQTGRPLWRQAVESSVPINVTQLLGHPDYVALLIHRGGRVTTFGADAAEFPALQLIAKRGGEVSKPFSIADAYKVSQMSLCDPLLLVTPARLIVQIDGNVLAFGNPPAQAEP
jgi:tetratricopeptide (TPR) repeat protein